jgi:hypothetical protein
MDFYIPGVPLEKLREAGLRASRGGVGFYPSSNFVHLDTGSVRHWPRVPEAQLAQIMAKGPLSSSSKETRVAAARLPNPLAKLFGGAQEEDGETIATTPSRPAVVAQRSAPKSESKPESKPEKTNERPVTVAAVAPVPTPTARPVVRPAAQPAAAEPAAQPATFEMASATSRPVQLRPAQSASLVNRAGTPADGNSSANNVISERGFWQGLPDTEALQASVAGKARRPAGTTVAAADSQPTGSVGPWQVDRQLSDDTLAYAAPNHPAAKATSPATATARQVPAQRDTTVAVKRAGSQPTVVSSNAPAGPAGPAKVGQKFNDPWMRAMIIAPSAGGFMSTGLLGAPDYRVLSPYLRKPEAAVMMTFAQDPHLGMTTTKFAGTAVVFVSTVTFNQRTAALR